MKLQTLLGALESHATAMKTTIYCLLIAIVLRCAFEVAQSQMVDVPTDPQIKADMIFVWKFYGERRAWLKAFRYDGKEAKNGYDPSFTYLVSDYIPQVKKIAGKYQITFTDQLTKDLP